MRRHLGTPLAVGLAVRLAAGGTDNLTTVPQHAVARSLLAGPSADISADGRFVAFESYARLVPADTDDRDDIYVLDRHTGEVTFETGSVDPDVSVSSPRISADGRLLVFEAAQTVADKYRTHVVLLDRASGATTILSRPARGEIADGSSRAPDISDDGRLVVFSSFATNLVSGADANGSLEDVYAVDLTTGAATRVSVDHDGIQPATGASIMPAVSADGHAIAFASTAPLEAPAETGANAPANPANPPSQVYVRDRVRGTTRGICAARAIAAGERGCFTPAISANGRYVAFVSDSSRLVAGDRNTAPDVFLFDREDGSTILVSRAADGGSANGTSLRPALSADGRFVAFQSDASDLLCAKRCPDVLDDINLLWDVFVFDRLTGTMSRISGDESGGWMEPSGGVAIAPSAMVVAFSSLHPIDGRDRANDFDLFVRSSFAESSTLARRAR